MASSSNSRGEQNHNVRQNRTVLMASYNMKGGVAKTTSVLEFGYILSKSGLKVLLVDADMQANLTTKFIYSKCISERTHDIQNMDEESQELLNDEVEGAYDEMWKQIGVDEVPTGDDLRTFDHILSVFTRDIPQFRRQRLDRIKPFEAIAHSRTGGNQQVLDLIAGHLRTGDYDDSIREGFSLNTRHAVLGLVTNVIREFAEKKQYDLVIFDLGPYLSPVAQAVLLGVDYIFSPFKCERDCVTAAEIVPRKLRDWHKIRREDNVTLLNDKCVYKKLDDWFAGYRIREADTLNEIVSPRLRCFPVLLGAFPVAVAIMSQQPTLASRKYLIQIEEAYKKTNEYIRLFATRNNNIDEERKSGFKFIFTASIENQKWVENSYSTGMMAPDQKEGVPCVSWCADYLEAISYGNSTPGSKKLFTPDQMRKAKTISSQYGAIFLCLLEGMCPEHKEYLEAKINKTKLITSVPAKLTPRKKKRRNDLDGQSDDEFDEKCKLFQSEANNSHTSLQSKTGISSSELYKKPVNNSNISDKLESSGLELQKTGRKAGECFYEAIEFCIEFASDVQDLRQKVYEEILRNRHIYQEFISDRSRTIEYYADQVLNNQWAGDIEIEAMSSVLKRPIIVVQSDGVIHKKDNLEKYPEKDAICVYYNRRDHYDALILNKAISSTARDALNKYERKLNTNVIGWSGVIS